MSGEWTGTLLVTLALLAASVIDDLRSRKVHNSLQTSIFVVALWTNFAFNGVAGLPQIGVSILAAFAFGLPLYMLKALGGGDFKLLVAISPLLSWPSVGWTLFYSLFWGALLGLVMVIVKREGASFFRNMTSLALTQPVKKENLHKLPFTVAILFGFLTQAELALRGVSLL